AAGATHIVRLMSHRGLSAAFMTGIQTALGLGADIIVNTDADHQYRGEDVARLIAPIISGSAEVVIGDRDMRRNPHMNPIKRLLQRMGSWAVGIAAGISVPDVTSGFRAFSREAGLQINVFNPFTYTLETIIQAGNRNLDLRSVPVRTNAPTRPSRLYSGLWSYIRKSVVTIFRIYTLYKPLKTFFLIGMILFLPGAAIGGRFLYYYFAEGSSGHVQSLILAAILLISAFQTILFGLLADLVSVSRRIHEETLIRQREHDFGTGRRRRGRGGPKPRIVAEQRTLPAAEIEPDIERQTESQWVWLIEEQEPEEAVEETEPAAAGESDSGGEGTRRRRRRRRGGAQRAAEPRERKHHPKLRDFPSGEEGSSAGD
ncbi:MAG TPA: glycosyltransferase family 2 protein, partial [Thermoanaerobaculia bacterium]|nr:glycosyltransferase family 2 protein [Thermoanaerobaculia bacterium]